MTYRELLVVTFGVIGVLLVAGVAAYYAATTERQTPRRVVAARSRAGETRTRRRALVAARRRARAIRRWLAGEWDGLRNWAGPLETRTWARRAITARLQRLRKPDITPGPPRSDPRTNEDLPDGSSGDRGSEPLSSAPVRQPTRLATEDERRDAEVRASRPWSDDTGSFTAFVEEAAS